MQVPSVVTLARKAKFEKWLGLLSSESHISILIEELADCAYKWPIL